MEFEPKIIRSKRKTLAIEIRLDMSVTVRVPLNTKQSEIEGFISEKRAWIEKSLEKLRQRASEADEINPFTDEELVFMKSRAEAMLKDRLKYYSEKMGVSYLGFKIRPLISVWGTCSSNGNLTFNCLLALCPDRVVDYIVVHELCHRLHMNHSSRFWNKVALFCQDYSESRTWLKQSGSRLIDRMRKTRQKS